MTSVALGWTVFTSLTALIWLLRHRTLNRAARELPELRPDPAASAANLPAMTLLVAAKDEEVNIGRCVRSILEQNYPELRVIAANDRSADRTPQILDEIAAKDARLTVVHVKTLRDGWFGKNNAMREGLERATTEWLCFTDADCCMLSPHTLATVMRYAVEHGCDFVSVLPVLETHSLIERIIQPACGGILLIWFNPLDVNNPAKKAAYANGAFMMMTRAAYERIGGHERVKTEVNEDIHMARLAKQSGLKLCVLGNDRLYCVRMYANFREMWRGWSRIFYGCFGGYRKILLSMTAVLLVGIQPWVTLLAGAALTTCSKSPEVWRPVLYAGVAAAGAQLSLMIRYYRSARIAVWLAPTYPLAASLAVGMLISALRRLRGRGTTTWRGTTYRGDAVV